MRRIIILKIGTTSITTDCDKGVNLQILNDLAKVSAAIIKNGYRVVIVSSGAMGLGLARLGAQELENQLGFNPCKSDMTTYKQALTAIGQVELMKEYQNLFAEHKMQVGQVLVTHSGIKDDTRNSTIKETINKMFELGLIPIINANDTVSSKQIVSGDNDSLAARMAILLEAEKLFLITDVAGIYDKDPNKHSDAKLIDEVETINDELREQTTGSASRSGMGGMRSKLNAAEVCQEKGIQVEILDAKHTKDIDKFVLNKDHNIENTTVLPN